MKTWFITGISSAFDRLMTEKVLAADDRVTVHTSGPLGHRRPQGSNGDRLWLAALDLTHTGELRPTVDAAWAAMGHIDVVVSNAGCGLLAAVSSCDHWVFRRLLIQMVAARRWSPAR